MWKENTLYARSVYKVAIYSIVKQRKIDCNATPPSPPSPIPMTTITISKADEYQFQWKLHKDLLCCCILLLLLFSVHFVWFYFWFKIYLLYAKAINKAQNGRRQKILYWIQCKAIFIEYESLDVHRQTHSKMPRILGNYAFVWPYAIAYYGWDYNKKNKPRNNIAISSFYQLGVINLHVVCCLYHIACDWRSLHLLFALSQKAKTAFNFAFFFSV